MDSELNQEGIAQTTVEENATEPVSYATDMTKEELVQRIRILIDDQYYEAIINEYTKKLIQLLPSTSQNIPGDEKGTCTVAEECVRNGERPYTGTGSNSFSESDISEDVKQLNKGSIMDQELDKLFEDLKKNGKLDIDPKVLFLAAPMHSNQHGHCMPPEAFKEECDILCRIWPFFEEQGNDATCVVDVRTKEEMETAAKQFLKSVEKDNTGRAVIIFNGHGPDEDFSKALIENNCSGGWCVLEDGGMQTETFIESVADNIPKNTHVQLIFANCLGHLHDSAIPDTLPMLTITYFTRTGGGSISMVVHFQIKDKSTGKMRWCNMELEDYVYRLPKRMAADINRSSKLSSAEYVEEKQPYSAMETEEAADSNNQSPPTYEEIVQDEDNGPMKLNIGPMANL